jgi:hypothetical protein
MFDLYVVAFLIEECVAQLNGQNISASIIQQLSFGSVHEIYGSDIVL